MPLLAIELNDIGIRAARAGALLAIDGGDRASPGYACADGSSLITGLAAARQSCLRPRAVQNRFWDQLDAARAPAGDGPNRAEIAFAHLRHVLGAAPADGDGIVMAVPSTYERPQLGLLVGIARELALPLRGLVVAPVAVDPHSAADESFLLVEMGLHRTVLSVVRTGERVHVEASKRCPAFGLEALRRRWMDAIAAEFVRKTRFDPNHEARTEQKLFDDMPDLLAALARDGSIAIELEAGAHTHRVTVTDQLIARAAQSLVFDFCGEVQATLAGAGASTVLLSADAAGVPGLRRTIEQQSGAAVRELEPGAAAIGLTHLWPRCFEQPAEDGVAYHTSRQPGGAAAVTS